MIMRSYIPLIRKAVVTKADLDAGLQVHGSGAHEQLVAIVRRVTGEGCVMGSQNLIFQRVTVHVEKVLHKSTNSVPHRVLE